jgi:hypothetical protein
MAICANGEVIVALLRTLLIQAKLARSITHPTLASKLGQGHE